MKKIAASLLSADFSRLQEEIKAVEEAGADYLHLDVMDGHFVPPLTFGPLIIEKIKKVATKPLDVHLMIQNAEQHLNDYASAGADIISVHLEASPHLHRNIQKIKSLGIKASVALNPHSSLTLIEEVLHELDQVLLMSVNPGYGGQKFIESSLEKSKKLKLIREKMKLNFEIEMDGGIKTENIAQISQAGVDVFVVGSGIFCSSNYKLSVSELRSNY